MTTATQTATDHRLGFQSLTDERVVDSLELEGSLPAWLQGSLIRTGPAKFEVGDRSFNHWFDGLAMLHRFAFADGEVSYRNRFLESSAYRAATETGEISYSEFATDPCRSLFKRVQSVFSPKISDNANVNLTRLGRGLRRDDRDAAARDLRSRDARGRRGRLAGARASTPPPTPTSTPRPARDSSTPPSSAPGRAIASTRGRTRSASARSPSCRSRDRPTCTASASPSATPS